MTGIKNKLQNRGLVHERLLDEGYVVVIADYRGRQLRGKDGPK